MRLLSEHGGTVVDMSEKGGFRTGDQRGEMLGKIPLSHPLFLPYFIELQQFLLSKNKQDTSQKWYVFYAILTGALILLSISLLCLATI